MGWWTADIKQEPVLSTSVKGLDGKILKPLRGHIVRTRLDKEWADLGPEKNALGPSSRLRGLGKSYSFAWLRPQPGLEPGSGGVAGKSCTGLSLPIMNSSRRTSYSHWLSCMDFLPEFCLNKL